METFFSKVIVMNKFFFTEIVIDWYLICFKAV
jgi:hypothetical protein